ncbi:MAG TPA: SpoIIE family protein phosphatase [Polyangia bacterium]|nr:SpoIIE family protein phosphatase [Polyangia bacterium]
MAWLVAVDGELSGRRFSLDAPCLVGRGPYNHVVLDDTRISRQHAKVSPEPGGHIVYDLNSANGTFVNDVQVKRQKLAPGDVVRFGPFSFRFESEALDRTGPIKLGKFVEVHTQVGVDPPSKIIDSLDASLATNPGVAHDLAELEDADRKLRTLYMFMQSIATTLESGELFSRILKNLLELFPTASAVAVYLRELTTGMMEPRKVMRRDAAPPSLSTLPGLFHEEVVQKGRAILSAPLVPGGKGKGGTSMHAPMIFGNDVQGVLHVRAEDTKVGFNQGDLDLLTGLASQAAMALSNARMHAESLKQQRLQQDLLLAEQIQKSFLPRQLPSVEGIEFVTEYRPAYSVGGDFYDLFWLDHERIGVFIGDVSGKGVSAALLMARISSDLRVAALAESSPARAISRVNQAVLERKQHDIFVTGIYLSLDVKTKQLTLANAGHLPPFVRRKTRGELVRVEGGSGTAIGIFDEAVYEQTTIQLEPGDTLVLCTDGILEATDELGEQFGFERLELSLSSGTSRPKDVADRLQRDLREHVGDAAQYDDVTMILLGVAADPAPARLRRRDEPTQTVKPE